jgi:rhodanese-related sulfurtransferase
VSPRTLAEVLVEAAERIDRLSPEQAAVELGEGATLVDTRSSDSRRRKGAVPGALHVPRTVLEWRLEPGGSHRNPQAPPPGARVIVMCEEGFSSVLAAASLAELGFRAADVVGGFAAWSEAGLPVIPAPDTHPADLPGMAPPDGISAG